MGGGGGGYLDTYIGSGHFLGSKILNFNILGGIQKNNIFWGMNILWVFFASSQNWTSFGVFS